MVEENKTPEEKMDKTIKTEGQLLRNSGTNSIKSVNVRLEKFTGVLETIQTILSDQSSILRETAKIQSESLRDKEREDALKSVGQSKLPQMTGGFFGTGNQGLSNSETVKAVNGAGIELSRGILGALVGTGTAVGTVLGRAISPRAISGGLLRGGAVAILLPFVTEFTESFMEKTLENFNFDAALDDQLTQTVSKTAWSTAIGYAVAGRRGAIVGASAGFMASFADNLINFLVLDAESTSEIFGQEFTNENIAAVGLGAGGIAATEFLRSSAPLRRKLGLSIGVAVLGAYIAYGDELKTWIENQDFPTPVAGVASAAVDITGMAATGASFGMMFGPQGALAGAAIGFALGIGKSLFDFLQDSSEKAKQRFDEQVAEMDTILQRAAAGEDVTAEDYNKVSRTLSDANRRSGLLQSSEEQERIEQEAARARDFLARRPLDPTGVSEDQLSERVSRALEGDSAALDELLIWARSREENRGFISRKLKDSDRFIEDILNSLIEQDIERIIDNPEIESKWLDLVSERLSATSRLSGISLILNNPRIPGNISSNNTSLPEFGTSFAERQLMLETIKNSSEKSSLSIINNSPVNFSPIITNVSPTNISNSSRVSISSGENPTGLPGGAN